MTTSSAFAQLAQRLGDPVAESQAGGLPPVAEQGDERSDRVAVPNLGERFDRPQPEHGVLVPENIGQGRNRRGVPEPSEFGGRIASRAVSLPEDVLVGDSAPGRAHAADVERDIVRVRPSPVTDLPQDLREQVEQVPEPREDPSSLRCAWKWSSSIPSG